MFNIGENTKIAGLNNAGISVGHLKALLADKTRHDTPYYFQFGKRVSKGLVNLYTNGKVIEIYFEENNGWARLVEVVKVS